MMCCTNLCGRMQEATALSGLFCDQESVLRKPHLAVPGSAAAGRRNERMQLDLSEEPDLSRFRGVVNRRAGVQGGSNIARGSPKAASPRLLAAGC